MLVTAAAGVGVGAMVGFAIIGLLVCEIVVTVVVASNSVQPFPVELTTNPELHANEVDEQVAAGGH